MKENNEEILLYGLVATEPDYKISLILNKQLNIFLKINSPVEITGSNGNKMVFSRFTDSSGVPDIYYTLISNRSGNDLLFKKFNRIDYFLSVYHAFPLDPENLARQLRNTVYITAVFPIDSGEIDYKVFQY